MDGIVTRNSLIERQFGNVTDLKNRNKNLKHRFYQAFPFGPPFCPKGGEKTRFKVLFGSVPYPIGAEMKLG